jgi:hypothetical protein
MIANWYLDCPCDYTLRSELHLKEKFDDGLEKTQSIGFNLKGQGEKKGKSRKRKMSCLYA